MKRPVLLFVVLGLSHVSVFAATPLKTQSFDLDPGWEGHNNHIVPEQVLTVKQDFGLSDTNISGRAKGEIGGQMVKIFLDDVSCSAAASLD